MAFVRWRGRCCELIATVYENGRSKKITLANLQAFYVPEWIKKLAVERALAQGPPAILTRSTPSEHLDMATVEHYLRKWADDISKKNRIKEANYLRMAADVLTETRAEFYWSNSLT